MDLTKKLTVLVLLVCVFIALKNHKVAPDDGEGERLEYDYYRTSCLSAEKIVQATVTRGKEYGWPSAEEIVRTTVRELHWLNSSVGPALLRLAFHDCCVRDCDASVLFDAVTGVQSEKEAIPNLSLKVIRTLYLRTSLRKDDDIPIVEEPSLAERRQRREIRKPKR